MTLAQDWAAVLTGEAGAWLLQGMATTLCVTLAGAVVANLLGGALLAGKLSPWLPARGLVTGLIEILRNTPLLVQLLFWYFAAYGLLPLGARDWVVNDHPWAAPIAPLPIISAEFIVATWGLGVFFAAFIAEDLRAGLAALPTGQSEAAAALGLNRGQTLRRILLPQAIANSRQPLIGQNLNLMKNSTLASGIGLAEMAYQVRQVESFNAHTLQAFAVGSAFFLVAGFIIGRALDAVPQPRWAARPKGR